MKNFIQNLLRRKEIAAPFWRDSSARIVLRPPVPKCLVIARQGDTITVTETHVSLFGWLTSPSPDDVEMQFHIDDSGGWTPRYLKHGTEPARRFYDNEDGAISCKPVVVKRQQAFAAKWAQELVVRGMLRGIVEP